MRCSHVSSFSFSYYIININIVRKLRVSLAGDVAGVDADPADGAVSGAGSRARVVLPSTVFRRLTMDLLGCNLSSTITDNDINYEEEEEDAENEDNHNDNINVSEVKVFVGCL